MNIDWEWCDSWKVVSHKIFFEVMIRKYLCLTLFSLKSHTEIIYLSVSIKYLSERFSFKNELISFVFTTNLPKFSWNVSSMYYCFIWITNTLSVVIPISLIKNQNYCNLLDSLCSFINLESTHHKKFENYKCFTQELCDKQTSNVRYYINPLLNKYLYTCILFHIPDMPTLPDRSIFATS